MRLAILGSGSSGNVAFVETTRAGARPTRVLVDAGLSVSAIEARLAALDGAPTLDGIDAVLITHEHSDHVGCAARIGRPLWAPAATRRAKGLLAERVLAGQAFTVGALAIMPVLLPHDADETVGYVISDGTFRVGILTDCGAPERDVARAYAGCDVLVLESNHDPMMLMDGPYPPSLQRRVRGPRGHLSNAQSAELLSLILSYGPAPQMVIAAHISQKNNSHELVERALRPVVPKGTTLVLATPWGSPPVRVQSSRPRQLALFDLVFQERP